MFAVIRAVVFAVSLVPDFGSDVGKQFICSLFSVICCLECCEALLFFNCWFLKSYDRFTIQTEKVLGFAKIFRREQEKGKWIDSMPLPLQRKVPEGRVGVLRLSELDRRITEI